MFADTLTATLTFLSSGCRRGSSNTRLAFGCFSSFFFLWIFFFTFSLVCNLDPNTFCSAVQADVQASAAVSDRYSTINNYRLGKVAFFVFFLFFLPCQPSDFLQFAQTIGKGNFAKVKLARHIATDVEVAIKIITKTAISESSLAKVCQLVCVMCVEWMRNCSPPPGS
jgi:hypothetical protein